MQLKFLLKIVRGEYIAFRDSSFYLKFNFSYFLFSSENDCF